MHVRSLELVDGAIVVDLTADRAVPPPAAGRVVFDLPVGDVEALARTATYACAFAGLRFAGAGVVLRPTLLDGEAAVLDRFREEVVGAGGLEFDEVAVDARADANGVAAAAEAWCGGLDGRSVAVEELDALGDHVARELVGRGARLVGVSTEHGAVATAAGLDLDELAAKQELHGRRFVRELGLEVRAPMDLHGLAVDVLVVNGPPRRLDADVAAGVQADVVVPATGAAYTLAALEALRARGTVALPDFVSASGALLAAHAPRGLTRDETLGRVERLISEQIEAARLSKLDPVVHAAMLADTFLATWVPPGDRPEGPVST